MKLVLILPLISIIIALDSVTGKKVCKLQKDERGIFSFVCDKKILPKLKSQDSNNSQKSMNNNKSRNKRNKLKLRCEERFTEYITKSNIPNMFVNLLTLECPKSMFLQSMNLLEENISYQMKYKCCNVV